MTSTAQLSPHHSKKNGPLQRVTARGPFCGEANEQSD